LSTNTITGSGDTQVLVSIITTVFNGARSLEATLLSVQAQNYPRIEHWVIDAASTDGTMDIVRRHEGRLTGWVSEPDRGIADGFNKGLLRTRGDYVMFLNADDALAQPNALAEMLDYAKSSNWPDVIYGDCGMYDPDTGAFLYRATINYDRSRFLRGEALPHPGMLMHRRYFEKYGGFDLSYKVAMDYELFLRGVPDTGAQRAPVLVTNVGVGGISARSRWLVVEETIRALKRHGHLDRAAEARMRLNYAARKAARIVLEATGLYRLFDAWRRGKGSHA